MRNPSLPTPGVFLLAFTLVLAHGSVFTPVEAAPEPLPLWPDGAPGAVGDTPKDQPRIHLHRVDAATANGTAVIICPGGGYGGLAMSYEGHEVAAWFGSFGVTAAVLEYRTAQRYRHPAPLQDVQRAIRYVRSKATELGIDAQRVGVLGFSAGGHLAASAGTLFTPGDPSSTDPIETVSSRPDFMILAYPVITFTQPHGHQGSRRNLLGEPSDPKLVAQLSLESRVTAKTPPAFLFHTNADTGVVPENSILFYQALRHAGVPAELHIYREGWHGVGLDRFSSTAVWPEQARSWMYHLGLLDHPRDIAPKWIWLSFERSRWADAYFRKVIESPADVEEAWFVGTARRGMTVSLNGEYVVSSTYAKEPVRGALTDKLRPGSNLLTVSAQGERWDGGLIGSIHLRRKNGQEIVIPTDRTWRVNHRERKGWDTLEFDAERSRFQPATVVAALGEGPLADDITEESLREAKEQAPPQATQPEAIRLLPGFEVELLYSVPKHSQGSWVSLAVDPKGRIYAGDQYGGLYRLTPPPRGEKLDVAQIEKVPLDISGAHGLLYAFDSLYLLKNEGRGETKGLYRLRDTDGDDRLDEAKLLRSIQGGGEHGPHSIVLGPDGNSLYVTCGNSTDLPNPEKSLAPRIWKEDQVLPRMWDARGHARGRLAPGGWIARTNLDGSEWELVCLGFRNEFDLAFSPEGELFSFDADMEWDLGSPWYRPTRVNHVVSGADFGWRSGTGKWPAYYADSVGSVIDIGPGSPTGIVFGTGTHFPKKYQQALFICDWSYGKLHAVHMEPDGATWKGTAELFMSASPLPLTDLVVHPGDGALYVAIGGRRAQSGLYRITHSGGHRAEDLAPRITPEAKLRRELERFHAAPSATAINAAWPYLSHADRSVRYAARLAIEHRPVAEWQEKALQEKRPVAAIEAAIALARHAAPDVASSLVRSLRSIDWESLPESQKLALLRAYGLTLIRLGPLNTKDASELKGRLAPYYPAKSYDLNRELSTLLIALDAENVVEKTLQLLTTAPTQEEQIHYALVLRVAKTGWSLPLRKQYFGWFQSARNFSGGASFHGFLKNIKNEALENVPETEHDELAEVLSEEVPTTTRPERPQPKGPGRNWTPDELVTLATQRLGGRDYENGKNMFAAASCFVCHRFKGQGGAMGPDLTGVSGRFSARDLIESILEPSKAVSDQYEATTFELKDDLPVTGRVVNLNGDSLMVNTNMLDAGQSVRLQRRRILRSYPSKTSMMPSGLLNALNEEEVLDLMAYLLSAGDPESPIFTNQP